MPRIPHAAELLVIRFRTSTAWRQVYAASRKWQASIAFSRARARDVHTETTLGPPDFRATSERDAARRCRNVTADATLRRARADLILEGFRPCNDEPRRQARDAGNDDPRSRATDARRRFRHAARGGERPDDRRHFRSRHRDSCRRRRQGTGDAGDVMSSGICWAYEDAPINRAWPLFQRL